jgi:hypothetical protein
MPVERMKVAPDTVAYADGERRMLVVEFAIPGAPTETIDVKILKDPMEDAVTVAIKAGVPEVSTKVLEG